MTDIIKDDSRFIHGEDLQRDGKWCDVTLTLKSVGEKDSITSQDKKTIRGYPVTFAETEKMAVFAGNNIRCLKAAVGTNNRSEMKGKKLTLDPAAGDWFGQRNVVAVRIRIPEGQPRPFVQRTHLGRDLTK